MTRRRRQGITLVELMITVTILVSLTTVLAVNAVKIWKEHLKSETALRLNNAEQGVQAYAAVNRGRFPSTEQGLEAALPYMSSRDDELPTDAWGNTLVYRSPDGDWAYSIGSHGPDEQEGGDDDIVVRMR